MLEVALPLAFVRARVGAERDDHARIGQRLEVLPALHERLLRHLRLVAVPHLLLIGRVLQLRNLVTVVAVDVLRKERVAEVRRRPLVHERRDVARQCRDVFDVARLDRRDGRLVHGLVADAVGDDVEPLVEQPLRVAQVEQMRRGANPARVRLIDERTVHGGRHVHGTAGDVHLDDVHLHVRVLVGPVARLLFGLEISQALRGDQHARTVERAAARPRLVPELQRVAHDVETDAEHLHGGDAVVGVLAELVRELLARRALRHVRVEMPGRIDQAGHDRLAREVHARGAGRNRHAPADRLDAAVRHDNRGAFNRPGAGAVDDARAGQRHDAAGGCLRVRRVVRHACPDESGAKENCGNARGDANHVDLVFQGWRT